MSKLFFPTLLFMAFCCFSCKKKTLFSQVSSFHSGIDFNNHITESDSINPLDKVNIYNGGGVGVGDFNNDGLPDLYFTGNMVFNKLYLNKGDFKFDDVTDAAAVGGEGRWARGVAVVDINNDGLADIYVCNTLYNDSLKRRNILYVNQGLDKDGIPHFKNLAKEYGLEASTLSTMASFFDYDNDGDLDMYLTVNDASSSYNPNVFGSSNAGGKRLITGRLYRNDFNSNLHHPVFTDVSRLAGINLSGFGHAATTVDFNGDGWKDIYVSDDFISNNILYINNHDGTFTDRSREYFKHTSLNSMGQDVIDINNDGLPDVVELDMNPPDNYRKKMMMSANSYQNYQSLILFGNEIQYIRNTLQLNQGPRVGQQGKIGSPVFSEIGFLAGIAQTDWSWTPLVADFDNDGFRDIMVTNGFRKDVSDHDFMTYRQNAYVLSGKMNVLKQIPEVKLNNFVFQNKGNLQFEDVSKKWGIDEPSFSNGAVYVDLDNDGAMDMVVSNIDDKASVYRNTSGGDGKTAAKNHFINLKFKGNQHNINGLGATAEIYYDHGKKQIYENDPYRGYLSSMQNTAHFGLGGVAVLDSILIKWPGGKVQKLVQVKANQNLSVNISNAVNSTALQPDAVFKGYFKEVTDSLGLRFKQKKIDFIDFNVQKLLPHKLSEYNPALVVGDVDGNGTDDLIIGGDNFAQAQVFLQQPNGKFKQRDLLPGKNDPYKRHSDAGLLLFDANGDGKLDLYAASGGYQETANTEPYQDRLYLNDGKGNFTLIKEALPQNYTSKLCVKAC
ncbi:MAG: VCBS repeat-containing protein, partial [Janthinobacterium lividum]